MVDNFNIITYDNGHILNLGYMLLSFALFHNLSYSYVHHSVVVSCKRKDRLFLCERDHPRLSQGVSHLPTLTR